MRHDLGQAYLPENQRSMFLQRSLAHVIALSIDVSLSISVKFTFSQDSTVGSIATSASVAISSRVRLIEVLSVRGKDGVIKAEASLFVGAEGEVVVWDCSFVNPEDAPPSFTAVD